MLITTSGCKLIGTKSLRAQKLLREISHLNKAQIVNMLTKGCYSQKPIKTA